MEINYELTTEDFVEFQKIVTRQNKTHINIGRTIGVVFTLLILADFIYCLVTGLIQFNGKSFLLYLFGRFLLQFLFLIAAAKALYWGSQKLADKATNKIGKNGVFCEHRLVLDEDELIEITDVNTSQFSWIGIGEITENEKFVVIPINLSASFTVPKRYFTDSKHLKEFIDTANEYRQNAQLRFNPSHLARFEIES